MQQCSRRRVLAAGGVVGAVAVAGCLGDDSGEGSADSEPSGTQLGDIRIENIGEDEHTIDVLVEFEGEIEHWSTHEFDAESDGVTIEPDWPEDPGEFRVTVRIDGREFTQRTPSDLNEPDCTNLIVFIERDGSLTVSSATEGGPCGNGDVDPDEAEAVEDDASSNES